MNEGMVAFDRAVCRLVEVFGRQAAEVAVGIFTDELGDMRLTFPSANTLKNLKRDQMIKNSLNGSNYEEIAIRFKLSVRQVRRIERK